MMVNIRNISLKLRTRENPISIFNCMNMLSDAAEKEMSVKKLERQKALFSHMTVYMKHAKESS